MICKIRSGGQSGVDQAALDIAMEYRIPICGWCPKGGWAENYPEPLGVMEKYDLTETPSERVEQRTVWNVRDADATLVIQDNSVSKGTDLTYKAAKVFRKPYLVSSDEDEIVAWLKDIGDIELNIGGPRESESPGIYEKTRKLIEEVLKSL